MTTIQHIQFSTLFGNVFRDVYNYIGTCIMRHLIPNALKWKLSFPYKSSIVTIILFTTASNFINPSMRKIYSIHTHRCRNTGVQPR